MRAQGSGRIVNVSTIGSRIVFPLIEPGMTRTNFLATATYTARRFSHRVDSPYYRYLEPFNRFMVQVEAFRSSPEAVASVTYHALTARHPRARYVATPDARLMSAILPWLPDRKRDALWIGC